VNPEAVLDMAKKSAKAKPHLDPERKPMVVQIRGSASYKVWAERVAVFDGSTLAALYDRAVRQYAKSIGFPDGPPVR
jgi:putative IMPACT (imprinted ancient) family translation regulator